MKVIKLYNRDAEKIKITVQNSWNEIWREKIIFSMPPSHMIIIKCASVTLSLEHPGCRADYKNESDINQSSFLQLR